MAVVGFDPFRRGPGNEPGLNRITMPFSSGILFAAGPYGGCSRWSLLPHPFPFLHRRVTGFSKQWPVS